MDLSGYIGLVLFLAIVVATGSAVVVVSHLFQIRVKSDKYDWTKPYECGLRTSGLKLDRYPIHYYLVGILFVIFDVETVFFIPWAVIANHNRGGLPGVFWFVEMLVFLVILIVGYSYLLSRGVFNWGHEKKRGQATSERERYD